MWSSRGKVEAGRATGRRGPRMPGGAWGHPQRGDLYAQVAHAYPDILITLRLYESRILSGSLTLREHRRQVDHPGGDPLYALPRR